mmetsp:Transcript_29664/g.58253  ORF Transcript_29664/g.58253 Transcript_29664/m.58253 type:complete len:120 (-) Transcript_29664:898-1257(-)
MVLPETMRRSGNDKNSHQCAETESCSSLSTGEPATNPDIDSVANESDQERMGATTWNSRFLEEDAVEPVDLAAWNKVSERLATTFSRCSTDEAETVGPQAWRIVGARIFQSLADVSDDE